MEYAFDLKTQNGAFTVAIDSAALYGYFEHETHGDECGGWLWFDSVNGQLDLTDYDGVPDLPKPVIEALESFGVIVDDEFK